MNAMLITSPKECSRWTCIVEMPFNAPTVVVGNKQRGESEENVLAVLRGYRRLLYRNSSKPGIFGHTIQPAEERIHFQSHPTLAELDNEAVLLRTVVADDPDFLQTDKLPNPHQAFANQASAVSGTASPNPRCRFLAATASWSMNRANPFTFPLSTTNSTHPSDVPVSAVSNALVSFPNPCGKSAVNVMLKTSPEKCSRRMWVAQMLLKAL